MFAAVALIAASCSSEATEETEETQEEEVVEMTYSLDAENSSLGWKGSMGPEKAHVGTVNITEGSLTVKGEEISGSFVIDMTTITPTADESLEEGLVPVLGGHLQGTMVDEDHPAELFFNTPAHPTAKVEVMGYADGKLSTKLTVVGKELEQEIPATLTNDENGASISGTFSLDMAKYMIPGFQPDPESGAGIGAEFTLDVKLTK